MTTHFSKSKPLLGLLVSLSLLPQLSETIYSPSLPQIATELHTSNTLAQWSMSIYLVGFALGVFGWGNLSDRHGRKPMMLLGLSIYVLSTIACYFSPTISTLLFFRLFQAIGISTGTIVVQTMVRDIYPPEQRSRVFAIIISLVAFAPAIGPFIGGYVAQYLNWRDNFLILICIGTLLAVSSFFWLPETHPHHTAGKKISSHDISLQSLFMGMIKDRAIIGFSLIIGIVNGCVYSYYSEAPFIFVDHFHLASSQYGKLGVFIAIAAFSGAMLSRQLSPLLGPHRLIQLGCFWTLAWSTLLFALSLTPWLDHLPLGLGISCYLLPVMGMFASFCLITPSAMGLALEKYAHCLGTAGSILGLFYNLLMSFVTFGMGGLHNGHIWTLPTYFLLLSLAMLGIRRCLL